jgi:NDP-sugar pyrophosphorylase family protein
MMEAMIFSAGLGTRLYPVSKDRPKALAPFNGETLLSYNLNYLASQGIDHFVINTHHFATKIAEYLDQNDNFGLDIKLSYEPVLLDTAGGIAHALHFFNRYDTPVLFYNVDVITNISINSMLGIHETLENDATLAVRNRKTSRYLLFDNNERLAAWKNQHTSEFRPKGFKVTNEKSMAFSGIQLISRNVLANFEQNRVYSLIDFYLENMDQLKIGAYHHDSDYWFDCGKPDTLHEAEEHIKHL